jgi:hypothetical protein
MSDEIDEAFNQAGYGQLQVPFSSSIQLQPLMVLQELHTDMLAYNVCILGFASVVNALGYSTC